MTRSDYQHLPPGGSKRVALPCLLIALLPLWLSAASDDDVIGAFKSWFSRYKNGRIDLYQPSPIPVTDTETGEVRYFKKDNLQVLDALLKALADDLYEGRVVCTLEGGYDHTVLAWSVRACIDALSGNEFAEDPLGAGPAVPGPNIDALLAAVKRAHALDAE